MENTVLSIADRFNNWIANSIIIKLLSIGFLILILLIPSAWIESLIQERQVRSEEVISEISDKWSGEQTLLGPVLVIPFTKTEKVKTVKNNVQVEEIFESEHRAYFLPEQLHVESKLTPQVLHRGIFDAVVYDSKTSLTTKFSDPDFSKWNIPEAQVHWKDAMLVTGISDLRGISENPMIQSGDKSFVPEPSGDLGLSPSEAHTSGISTLLGWSSRTDFRSDFSMNLQLKGSELIHFVPTGKTTEVKVGGGWASPSFDGAMLPTSRTVNEKDFSATWKVLSFNRPFSQQWMDHEQSLKGSEFGVRLLIPADQYQQSIRTAKYGVLVIILAFMALFLVELTAKIRIHPFQYILIGAALTIYYTLLLSLSEHLGYNVAYVIASLSTIILLAFYSMTFLIQRSLVILFTLLMSLFYTFIFVIIQAEDYSLLIGSVGLFIIIATIMYFSRNIRWYK
ncbi:MAG TPA: cell envelope integrity protein CreD [Cyclobacteriaceae bacterium]|nr:cell envelope integrity protein CreD [Cyclobacteriaceae bacterium]